MRGLSRNRSANKELEDAIAAAALVGDLRISDLDDVLEEVQARDNEQIMDVKIMTN